MSSKLTAFLLPVLIATSFRKREGQLEHLLMAVAIFPTIGQLPDLCLDNRVGAGGMHGHNDRELRSHRAATAVATAADQFYTEYNTLPDVPGRVTTDTREGIGRLNILSGLDPIGKPSGNVRKIRFVSVQEKKGRRGGVEYDSKGEFIIELYDRWGNPFTVFLYTDLNEVIHLKLGSKEKEAGGEARCGGIAW